MVLHLQKFVNFTNEKTLGFIKINKNRRRKKNVFLVKHDFSVVYYFFFINDTSDNVLSTVHREQMHTAAATVCARAKLWKHVTLKSTANNVYV